jgi:hypothetical protein
MERVRIRANTKYKHEILENAHDIRLDRETLPNNKSLCIEFSFLGNALPKNVLFYYSGGIYLLTMQTGRYIFNSIIIEEFENELNGGKENETK